MTHVLPTPETNDAAIPEKKTAQKNEKTTTLWAKDGTNTRI